MDFREYNITIRLGSLLSLPSKFIQRLRRIDDMLNMDLEAHHTTPGLAMSMTSAAYEGGTHIARPPPSPHSFSYELIVMPGAFSFLTSGYALGLLAMVCSHYSFCCHTFLLIHFTTDAHSQSHSTYCRASAATIDIPSRP